MIKGPLLLAGSGEFTDAMTDVDRYFLRNINNPSVAILPTAAGKEHDWWKWVTNGISHYKKLGIPASGIQIQNKQDTDNPSVLTSLEKANVFYFSGGDPGYVLSAMQDSPAWNVIFKNFQNGAALAGSSAGAMMLGSWIPKNIRGVLEHDKKEAGWTRALGLIPYIIWPHFDWGLRMFGDKIEKLMGEGDSKSPWLGIDEDTAVIWENNNTPVVKGRGKAHWGNV